MRFEISTGKHSCTPRMYKLYSGGMQGRFMLDPLMWYDTDKVGNHLNKLVGFGTDIFNSNSLRLAWRPDVNEGVFEIFAYIHLNGVWVRSGRLIHDLVLECHAKVWYDFSIMYRLDDIVRFTVGAGVVERHYPVNPGTGWFMQFYFGGKPVAPWAMSADIEVNGLL